MKYYVVNLIAHSLVTIALIAVIIVTFSRNQKRKTKHVQTYFLPFIFAIFAVLDLCFLTGPRLLDLSSMINDTLETHTGVVTDIAYFNNYIEVDGHRYYLNPLNVLPNVGDTVKVRFTPNAGFAGSLELIATAGTTLEPLDYEEYQ